MAYIELVIKIPKKLTCEGFERPFTEEEKDILIKAIGNGKPLPKGHGRLKDIDRIISDGISKGFCEWYDEMKYATTIIEADTAESEG